MTVIAWDGKTMAADRQGELCCTKTLRTKIRRIGPDLVGCAGHATTSEAVCHWLEAGANHCEFPKPNGDERCDVLVAGPSGLRLYQNSPHAMRLENKFFAIGCGGDAAMAAMYLGFDAATAVSVACEVCTGCGGGLDTLELAP